MVIRRRDDFPVAFMQNPKDEASEPLCTKELILMSYINHVCDMPQFATSIKDTLSKEALKAELMEMGATVQEAAYVFKEIDLLLATIPWLSGVNDVLSIHNAASAEETVSMQQGVRRLESAIDWAKHWHPNTNDQVLDVAHPSTHPFVYEQTHVLRDRMKNLTDWKVVDGTSKALTYRQYGNDNDYKSKSFQWLASEFGISKDGKVKILSYINNLHPDQFSDVYRMMETAFARMVPLFELVCEYMREPTHPRMPVTSDAMPALPTTVAAAGWKREGYALKHQLLQVVTKLESIHLTADKPSFSGNAWHVEGSSNEEIVACGVWFYDVDNVTDARWSFRTAVKDPAHAPEVYGLAPGGVANQERGYVTAHPNRIAVFPNTYQHRQEPFQLVDPDKPGHLKYCVFMLVNPEATVLSTCNALPQQIDWYLDYLTADPECKFSKLPRDVVYEILNNVPGLMLMKQNRQNFLDITAEHAQFTELNNQKVFERRLAE
jgi:hypothetical protein